MQAVLVLIAGAAHSGGHRLTSRLGRGAPAVRMDDLGGQKPSSGIRVVDRPEFTCSFEMPKKSIAEYGTANMKFKPLLVESEALVVRYELPFGLNAEPRGRVAVITKDGPGGEKVGDILRFTTEWKQTQPGIFDVSKCLERRLDNSWDQVVAALVSNDGTYGDSIVLVLERPTGAAAAGAAA